MDNQSVLLRSRAIPGPFYATQHHLRIPPERDTLKEVLRMRNQRFARLILEEVEPYDIAVKAELSVGAVVIGARHVLMEIYHRSHDRHEIKWPSYHKHPVSWLIHKDFWLERLKWLEDEQAATMLTTDPSPKHIHRLYPADFQSKDYSHTPPGWN